MVKRPIVLGYLLALAQVEGMTPTEAARALGISRQGLYKALRKLKGMGLIEEGAYIKFSEAGRDELREILRGLMKYFSITTIRLEGYVARGLGEGAFYVSLEGYKRQIEEKLGFAPYPGTLNIVLAPDSLPYRRYLDSLPGILLEGFSNGLRTYGRVKAFRCRIGGIEGAVLVIERTHHGPEVVEVVAPIKLRDALSLKDGDPVSVEVELL
ncbi:MAG: CTP-dependent riboflavin kinase [Thermoproteus sp.]|nr:CTP-dependent riboflavin kinase [Thermoproteus sp.]